MKPKYGDNVKLCYMDTDSFIMNIKTGLFIKPGIQERGTECGERGECSLRFRGMLLF